MTGSEAHSSDGAVDHKETVQALLFLQRAGVDLDAAPGSDRRTALCSAAAAGVAPVVAALIMAGADLDKLDIDGSSPLLLASMEGHLATVNLLLEHGADSNTPDAAGFTPLFVAAQEGHLGVVCSLVAAGASTGATSAEGATALAIASECGHMDVVKQLARAGAEVDSPNGSGATPLYMVRTLATAVLACSPCHPQLAILAARARANIFV
jgi:ankyrin repeat protein